ncbi:MAG: metallophosphoesterase [Actinobacteria bacterium]|nr:metallophosphoesterase [Actinomycetota bacterium]
MRALVISDTHFGAWTGRDLLREDFFLERLAPALDGVDEVILLGDLFDFLFGSVADAVESAAGLLRLIAEKLSGRRFVFLAGNHDHHLVHRDEESRVVEAALARGEAPQVDGVPPVEPPGPAFFQEFLQHRLPGVEVEIAYPTYEAAGVLCTHGHYLDPHARMSGSRGSRLLTRALWAIASGGPEEPSCEADYESVTTLLTEWLYIAAQMPHGTHAQRGVFAAAQRAGRVAQAAGAPVRGARRAAAHLRDRAEGDTSGLPSAAHFDAVVAEEAARQAREQPLPGPSPARPRYPEPTVLSRSSPTEHALEAFSRVVANLGWDQESERIVFAHTHQPLADARASQGSTRYWNSGCWIYEPDLSSRQAYARYCRYAWPGTAIVIDNSEPQPRLLELLADLNPLAGGPGLPKAPA